MLQYRKKESTMRINDLYSNKNKERAAVVVALLIYSERRVSMTDKKLAEDIKKARDKRPPHFYGFTIAAFSILYGEFILRVDGFLLSWTEPYFQVIPVTLIGILLIIAGAIKISGIILNNTFLRKIGIWSLSGVWSGLFVLALSFSFGTGYPHPSYLFNGLFFVICLRVSIRGNFS